ncbi:hypothetical protein SAMN05216404_101151 [Nitrosospira multiformis]|uniref:Uncharacterized protein n=1 Tax=Nitrosospira multiformis TaxID=1231 RepID=A0A1H8B9Q5_9PROT|nr:hypothetical protein SAMN05216404_101151 [Nitrosospira multiformis]
MAKKIELSGSTSLDPICRFILPIQREIFKWKVFCPVYQLHGVFSASSLAMRPSALSRLDIAVAKESLM